MKTLVKVALITAGITLSAGIAMTAVGMVINHGKPVYVYYDHGFKVENEMTIVEMEKTTMDDFSSVDIDINLGKVKFIESEDDTFAVEYKLQKRGEDPTCEVKDGKLTVKNGEKNHFFFNFGIDFSDSGKDLFLYVYYPHGTSFEDISLDTSAGSVEIEQGFDCENFILDASAGSVKVKNVNGNFDVDMSAGSITCENCNIGKCKFDMSAGSVKLQDCTSSGGSVDMSAGDFDAYGFTLTGDMKIDMSAGDVDIEFVDGQNIGYEFDMSAGSAKINGEKKGSEYEDKKGHDVILSVDASAGSVDIINN